jgi:hypothetical protein
MRNALEEPTKTGSTYQVRRRATLPILLGDRIGGACPSAMQRTPCKTTVVWDLVGKTLAMVDCPWPVISLGSILGGLPSPLYPNQRGSEDEVRTAEAKRN